ncbi:DinB family protein [Paenibacillus sp. JNUCC32]|uniref:DinB family protein n=1 Tax=Paenibacillus sp. JNUCC32 TaxID=2777984 RepID=UPI001787ED7A|nr:DinB family protein [Paenibacillus sp. JNUCC-32]QOT11091.1 DinB family protein [Paenibacillus sp. JNUCC-32]
MLYDLQGEGNMSTIVGMLYGAVRENSERLKSVSEGMSQEEVDYKGPGGHYNSAAQLIKHITYVDLNWVYRIKREVLPPSLKDEYGPMIDEHNKLPMVRGISLDTLLSKYEVVFNLLKDACSQLTDADLDRIVTFGHENEKQATLRWGLWHMADHNRYHQAHINQLRKWYSEQRSGMESE